MSGACRNRLTLLVAGSLVAAFLAQGWFFVYANSQTFDEAVHFAAGYSYLAKGDFRLNSETPPLSKLWCALLAFLWYRVPFDPDPNLWAAAGKDEGMWRMSETFVHHAPVPAHDMIALGRLSNLALGGCLVVLLGWWAYRLWGRGAALLAMAVAAFDPTLIAHSSVITSDMAITLFTFLTFYLLWRFVGEPSGRLLIAAGLSMGLVFVSKFSALLVLIIVLACIGAHLLLGGRFALGTKEAAAPLTSRIVEAIAPTLRIVAIALVVILPFYFFQGFTTWSTGLRTQMNQQSSGMTGFLLGENSTTGWWYYFPTAFAVKTPVGTLALLAATLLTIRMGSLVTRREVVFILLPAALYVLALTQLKLNIGVRFALPIYPLLFLLIGHLATVCRNAWVNVSLLGIPLAAVIASSLANAPDHLAYFNELVGGPSQGHRYLSDSNLDWGQGLIGLKQFVDREKLDHVYLSYHGTALPESYGLRVQTLPTVSRTDPRPDDPIPDGARHLLAISVTNLQNFKDNDYRWLLERTPTAKIGECIWVYDVTRDADAHQKLATMYERVGSRRLAEIERNKAKRIE